MREIVVNGTNILIDMHTAGLLEYIQKSSVRFHTVDFVIDELHRSPYRRPLIDELIQNGVLYVAETSPDEMSEIISLHSGYSNNTNLSFVDCTVMHYAKKHNYRLLTGDKKLRNHAIDEGVIVSGLLWTVDLFVNEGIAPPDEIIPKLQFLLGVNSRLPKKLIEEKIQQLTEMRHSI